MNFGGPVWHTSIAGRYGWPQWKLLEEIAELELKGVGNAALGEWRERGDRAFHLRRRLTVKEMLYAGIDAVCDVRGSEEAARRIQRMRSFLPPQLAVLPDEALP